jgi:hypothetical protein
VSFNQNHERIIMMTRIFRGIAASAVMACSSVAFADTTVGSALVTYSGTYGNGDVFVGINTTLAEPGCATNRVDVPRDSPAAAKLLETARLAKDKGLVVTVRVNGCYGGFPTLDNTRNTYFHFN